MPAPLFFQNGTAASIFSALSHFRAAPATCRQQTTKAGFVLKPPPPPPPPPELTERLSGEGRAPDKAGRI